MDIIKNGGSAGYTESRCMWTLCMLRIRTRGYSASGGREAEEKRPGRGWVVCQRRKGACETGGEEKAVSRERELGVVPCTWSGSLEDEAW